MKKYFIHTACLLTFALFFFGCNRGDGNPNPIPICPVRIEIGVMDNDLVPGNVKTFNNSRGMAGCNWHGTGGVVVYNINGEDFLAWDMACPNDHWAGAVVIGWQLTAQPRPLYFQCSMCHTRFDPLTGTPLPGAATRFVMRQYSVTRQANGTILVHN